MAREAERVLVQTLSGKDLILKESLTVKLKLLREEVGGPNPTALERLLTERVVACWLFLYYAENIMTQTLKSSMEWCEFHQRRIDHAHKRYLSAIRSLAQIRKLALPVLQVNIARKQVNIAGAVPADGD